MTKISFRLIIVLSIFLGITSAVQAEDQWVKALDKNGIVVYTRQPESSPVKEFKATTEIEASLNSLTAVIVDLPSFNQWYKNTGVVKLLETISEREQIYYHEVLLPMPFKNRDMVYRITFNQDPATKAVHVDIVNLPNYEFQSKGRVRMPVANGSWILTPLESGKVQVEHQFLADPGGNVPPTVVNMLIVGGPYSSLLKLKKIVKQEKYQQAKIGWIQ